MEQILHMWAVWNQFCIDTAIHGTYSRSSRVLFYYKPSAQEERLGDRGYTVLIFHDEQVVIQAANQRWPYVKKERDRARFSLNNIDEKCFKQRN